MKNIVTILLILVTFLATSQTANDTLMIKEINELRANPKSFIPNVEEYILRNERAIERIKSGKMKISSGKLNGEAVIFDRINAANELIKVLNTIGPLDTLTFNADMYVITLIHANYLDSINKLSHYDINGKSASDRFNSSTSENLISVGFYNYHNVTPLILTLLIDAGIENRGHRKNLLNKNIKYISVSITGSVCVQNFGR